MLIIILQKQFLLMQKNKGCVSVTHHLLSSFQTAFSIQPLPLLNIVCPLEPEKDAPIEGVWCHHQDSEMLRDDFK
jgi:hypothetical protein